MHNMKREKLWHQKYRRRKKKCEVFVCNQSSLKGLPHFYPWVRKIPWGKKWQPAPVILAREFQEGDSPWYRRVGLGFVNNFCFFIS